MNKTHSHTNIFIAYAIEDKPILEQLRKQLSILERNKEVRVWHDGMVQPSEEWAVETNKAIAEAQIILLLVSSDFIASDKCYENQLQKALQKHKEGTAQVIPIIARPCLWEETDFGHLKALSLLTTSDSKNEKDESYRKAAFALSNQVKDFRVVHKLQNRANNKSSKVSPTKLQNDLKKQITKGNLEETMDTLSSIENLDKGLNEAVTLLSHRFAIWKREKLLKLDTLNNLRVRKNLMVQALSLFIEELPENAQIPKRKRSFFSFLQFSQSTTPSETDAFAQEKGKIRDYLIERYTERLRQKTDHRLPVSLQLTYSKEGTSSDYAHFSKDIQLSEPIEGNLVEILRKHQHLLIIGNPGAGKTTQILDLAKEWLTEKVDEKLPIVFNLASWKPENNRFHEWLQGALVSGYGFSKKLAQEAILTNQILPLLDGLDEVGKDLENEDEQQNIRNLCLEAIDDYLGLLEVEYAVICSRRKEYSDIKVNAPVKAEVLVNPLPPKQIKATLKDSLTQKLSTKDENAANTLLQLLEQNSTLEEVLCTPFYYNIALEVFDSRSSNQNLPTTKTELEEYLVEQFIEEKLRDTPNRKGFLKEKTLDYLGWIGGMLNGEGKVVFELVSFQPRHLRRKWHGHIMLGLGYGFIGIVVGSWKLSLVLFLNFILAFPNIEPQEIRVLKWRRFSSMWMYVLGAGLVGGIGGSLVFGILGFLYEDTATGMSGGFYGGITFGFLGWLFRSVTILKSFSTINKPYFRFKNDIILKVTELVFIMPISVVVGFYSINKIINLENMLYYTHLGLLGGVFMGIVVTAFFKHLILRLCLFLEKKLPLQFVHFLQYATQARILEQDGGQWRFRHQILQDYFAERYGGNVNRNS